MQGEAGVKKQGQIMEDPVGHVEVSDFNSKGKRKPLKAFEQGPYMLQQSNLAVVWRIDWKVTDGEAQ